MVLEKGEKPPKVLILTAYLVLYVVWGSTYLGIKFTVETIPPLLAAGLRFALAGSFIVVFRSHGLKSALTLDNWKYAFRGSILPFAVSYGMVTYAETIVPSSVAALIVAMEPLWFCVIGWLFFEGRKPTFLRSIGIVLGFSGIFALVTSVPTSDLSLISDYTFGLFMLLINDLTWVLGAYISRDTRIHEDAVLSSGMQMLCGGAVMLLCQLVLSVYTGYYPDFASFSARSLIALGYLIVFGSMCAYSSFIWLLRVEPVYRVATYSFVNPIIAVFLGWLLGGEKLSKGVITATFMVIISIMLTLWEPKTMKT